jgi:predicted adenylyl cyclase CyaB
MRVRLSGGLRTRPDDFGGICYVPRRDDFFIANAKVFAAIRRLTSAWREETPEWHATYKALARVGVCETNPETEQVPYSGPSFLGDFLEIPTISEPLLVNCFSTAHCPLVCTYCHADDLMQQHRQDETEGSRDVENVVATASMFPSMVAVITGGDPLTRPERTSRLIERLAHQKALVLDTSGVGPLAALLPTLVANNVHVRISLDAIGNTNDVVRPVNRFYIQDLRPSREHAKEAIYSCLVAGLSVTVQTVVSTRNEHEHELMQLRDWLVAQGVRHWVLHVAVEGGSARRIERQARRTRRSRTIVPKENVYGVLTKIIRDTQSRKLPLDIRCTDTNSTPNSVLLIDSKGDLYTEGYAHNGKVLLFEAGSARPDLVKAKWAHIDRFGHAKRYLNWNKWLYQGQPLMDLCYSVPLPSEGEAASTIAVVETEAKYVVSDYEAIARQLQALGFMRGPQFLQRDEYFDTSHRALRELDFVVRLRTDESGLVFAFKGPRFFTPSLEYSRLEFQFGVTEEQIRAELVRQKLVRTWQFEKRRTEFRGELDPWTGLIVALDQVPEIGFFLEIEGSSSRVRALASVLSGYLGPPETRNYRDLFVAYKEALGVSAHDLQGATFESED